MFLLEPLRTYYVPRHCAKNILFNLIFATYLGVGWHYLQYIDKDMEMQRTSIITLHKEYNGNERQHGHLKLYIPVWLTPKILFEPTKQ